MCIFMHRNGGFMQSAKEEGIVRTRLLAAIFIGGLVLAGCSTHTTPTAQRYDGGNNGGRSHVTTPTSPSTTPSTTTPSTTAPPTTSPPTTTPPATQPTPTTTAPAASMPKGDSLGNMAIPGRPEYVAAQFTRYFDGESWTWGPWGWLSRAKPYMSPSFYATWLAHSTNPTSNAEETATYATYEKYKETEYVSVDESVLVDNGAATVNTSDVETDQVTYNLGGETAAGVKEPINPTQAPFVETYMMTKINGTWYVSGTASNGNG